jgi:hypothetical protein
MSVGIGSGRIGQYLLSMNDMQQHDVCLCMHAVACCWSTKLLVLLLVSERQLAKKADDGRPKTAQNKIKLRALSPLSTR